MITVPIILNVIENAKKGAAVDSAYGYKDAIEKYYLTELSKDSDFGMNGNYTIGNNGKLVGEENEDGETPTHLISLSGTVPSEGSISIENNTVKSACLVIDEYKIELQDGKFATSGKGECDSEPKVVFGGKVVTGDDIPKTGHTGVKAIVYLDPTNLATECDEEKAASNVKENGSPTGVNSGCMKWYAIDILSDDTTYTMILDHNTSDAVAWTSQDDWVNTELSINLGVTYVDIVNTFGSNGHHGRGPITVLKELKASTATWSDKLIINDGYNVDFENKNEEKIYYTIDYSGYKARLIEAEEISKIVGKSGWVLGTGPALDLTDYDWLYLSSYWTSSASNQNWQAWYVSPIPFGPPYPALYGLAVNSTSAGVRPVITVSKSLLSSE